MTGPAISVRSIGSTVAGTLAASATGSLLATFSRSCYLDLAGRIVALVAPDLLRGPLNVVVDPPRTFAFAALRAGAAVHLAPPRLAIDGGPTFDLTGARTWDAHLLPLARVDREVLQQRIDRIKRVLAEAPGESLAHPAGRSARAADGMDALYAGLRAADTEAVAFGARRLAGLGAGLTPSGDDVLTGVLVAVSLLAPPHAGPVRRAVMDAVRDRTTRISLAYVEAAARGEAGEAWHLLARHLEGGPDEAVGGAAARVMAFGETSGADMLAGFVLATQALR